MNFDGFLGPGGGGQGLPCPGGSGPPPGNPFAAAPPTTHPEGMSAQQLFRLMSGTQQAPPPPPPAKRDPKPSPDERARLKEEVLSQCRQEEDAKMAKVEFVPSQTVLQFLQRNDIRPLKKKSQKFPKAQYYCRLCSYHCDTIAICINHMEDTRHTKLARTQQLETTLYHLPKPNRHHLEVLDHLLHSTAREVGLPPPQVHKRQSVAAETEKMLQNIIPGCRVRMFGSTLTGLGLGSLSTDVNLDLTLPEGVAPHVGLTAAFEVIARCNFFTNVGRDFFAKIPIIFFSFDGVQYQLSMNNSNAIQTSRLILDYVSLDPRVRVLGICFRQWARVCGLDRQTEGTLPSRAFPLLLIHFLQQLKKPVLPCIHDYLGGNTAAADSTTSEGEDVSPTAATTAMMTDYVTPTEKLRSWKSRNDMSAAELWIEMFEYYSIGFNAEETVVSVRKAGGFTRDEKQWKGKKLTIEDPFSFKRSLTRFISCHSIFDFAAHCFKMAYLYFGCVQTVKGPIITRILLPESSEDSEQETASSDNSTAASSKVMTVEELERAMLRAPSAAAAEPASSPGANTSTFEGLIREHGTELSPKMARAVSDLVPKNMITFQFVPGILTAGQTAPLVCTVCGGEGGHAATDCPDEKPIFCPPVAMPSRPHRDLLDRVCFEVMDEWQPHQQELIKRDKIVSDLKDFISLIYPTSCLTVFGSSVNGFAFTRSDLDISMTFSDGDAVPAHHPDTVDPVEVLKTIYGQLQDLDWVENPQDITSAKVPIIKFTHAKTLLEADISLYNTLGQENTRLLRFYSIIDSRVRTLGYMAKLFAKTCGIGDASRGSLSSYAYILMLIHFLQQCKPPVVPVLQELHPGGPSDKPERLVEGWNAWFFDDQKGLKSVWPYLHANQQSVGELWLGFLDYYARVFDERRLVVSIRQSKILSKFEKMWNSPCFAIEDPFELSHNLGSGISRKMSLFIKTAFAKSLHHFAILPGHLNRNMMRYFFDSRGLTDGEPPNDRGCRACGKIGHLVRDCPRKKTKEQQQHEQHHQQQNKGVKTAADKKQPMAKQTPPTPLPAPTKNDQLPSQLPITSTGAAAKNQSELIHRLPKLSQEQQLHDPILQLSQQLMAPQQQQQQLPMSPPHRTAISPDPIMKLSAQLGQQLPPRAAVTAAVAGGDQQQQQQPDDLMAMLSGLGVVDSHKTATAGTTAGTAAVPISAAALGGVLLSESTAVRASLPPPGFQPLSSSTATDNSFFPHLGGLGGAGTPPSALGPISTLFDNNQLGYSSSAAALPSLSGGQQQQQPQQLHPLASLFQSSPFPTLDLGTLVQPRK